MIVEHDTLHAEPPRPVRVLLPSPIGELALEITGEAVTCLVIRPSQEQREGYVPFEAFRGSDFLDEVFGRLSEFFAGARPKLDIKFDLQPSGVTGFNRRVLKETAKIPFGRTRTYGTIAERAGQPDAYRLVLAALVINPIPILIPCHRVVTHKSGVGSYVAGTEAKQWLLDMEREALARGED